LKKIKLPIYTKSGSSIDKYFSIWIENPLHTWWKARKYFKFPKATFHLFFNPIHNCPYASLNHIGKILSISINDVMWKDKWNSPRFERNPHIWFCFFKKFGFSINFHVEYIDELGLRKDGSDYYWEYLLNFLNYSKDITDVDNWNSTSKIYKEYKDDKIVYSTYPVPITTFSLTKKGFEKLRKEC
jgi:hypothetical protein